MSPFLPRQGEVAAKLTEGEVNGSRRACGDAPSTIRYANASPAKAREDLSHPRPRLQLVANLAQQRDIGRLGRRGGGRLGLGDHAVDAAH